VSIASYADPVAKLLTYGRGSVNRKDPWLDYVADAGLTSDDVPELIRMMLDPAFNELDSESSEVWAPIHAIRALGQLRAKEAIAPLIEVVAWEDDFIDSDLTRSLSLIGAEAIAPLMDLLHDPEKGEWAKSTAVRAIAAIPKHHPEAREECVALLRTELRDLDHLDDVLMSSLVDQLVRLKAPEAAPEIEQAFATRKVDEFLTGSWAQVQVDLGLKQESDFTAAELRPEPPESIKQIRQMLNFLDNQSQSNPQGFGKAPSSSSTKKKKKKKKKK